MRVVGFDSQPLRTFLCKLSPAIYSQAALEWQPFLAQIVPRDDTHHIACPSMMTNKKTSQLLLLLSVPGMLERSWAIATPWLSNSTPFLCVCVCVCCVLGAGWLTCYCHVQCNGSLCNRYFWPSNTAHSVLAADQNSTVAMETNMSIFWNISGRLSHFVTTDGHHKDKEWLTAGQSVHCVQS